MDATNNEQKLNLRQLSAITFITSVFAEISDKDNITDEAVQAIISDKSNFYLKDIPYGKAKELIITAINAKNIIETI